jgi:hypothetical protein
MPTPVSRPRVSPLPARAVGGTSPLLAEVGMRTREPSHVFALRILGELGASLIPQVFGAADGRAFVDTLRDRIQADLIPLAGDLVIFEDGELVAVVTSVRPDGTVEFMYAQGGVVRRGFLNPARPEARRDERGRILNTFVRPFKPHDSPRQRYLAGELFSGYLRLDRLMRLSAASLGR